MSEKRSWGILRLLFTENMVYSTPVLSIFISLISS